MIGRKLLIRPENASCMNFAAYSGRNCLDLRAHDHFLRPLLTQAMNIWIIRLDPVRSHIWRCDEPESD